MEIALRDGAVVSSIISRLFDPHDVFSASIVCKAWNDVVNLNTHRLNVRSRTSLPSLISKFKNVKELDLSNCFDQLLDKDVEMIASSESCKTVTKILLGNCDHKQEHISNRGFSGLVKSFSMLEHIALAGITNLLDSGVLALVRVCKRLRSVSFEACTHLSDDALDSLSNCENLQELRLKGNFRFTREGLGRIGENCPMLVKICLEVNCTDVGLALKSFADHCVQLQELSLKFSYGELRELARLSTLVSLHIDPSQYVFCDVLLANIAASNKGLKEFVFLNPFSTFGDATVVALVENCRNIEKLSVSALRLTETALMRITECKTLKCLELHDYCREGQGMATICFFSRQLKELSLRFGIGIRDVELETLVMYSSKELERIDLHNCSGPSPRGFSAIGLCSNLKILDLSLTIVDDLSLITIANGVKMLRHLSLVRCEKVSDMRVLSNFRALEYLNVDECPFVTDEGLYFLSSSCSKLRHLSLASTRITDTGLSHLASSSMLQSLRIPHCRGVKGPGLVMLASSCNCIGHLVLSYHFEYTEILAELRKHCCMIQLDVDNMAAVPEVFSDFEVEPDFSDLNIT